MYIKITVWDKAEKKIIRTDKIIRDNYSINSNEREIFVVDENEVSARFDWIRIEGNSIWVDFVEN